MNPPKGVCVRRSVAAAVVGVLLSASVLRRRRRRAEKAVAALQQPRPCPQSRRPRPTSRRSSRTTNFTVGGRTLRYTATVGRCPSRRTRATPEASIFYVAYTLDGVDDTAKRPLMFSFNGGPGSSSVWLHLGALGPRRVRMLDDGGMPAPPFTLVDNEQTWLDRTDLVFIDPVGTGYSRPAKPELGSKFWNLDGDIQSVGEFIRLYLTRSHRWTSPLFLVGESYGTTRAAGLSGALIEQGIAFNGIVLVSSILNFQTAEFTKGNDLPYVLYLPTYAATAWYHKRLAPDLQADFQATMKQVEAFALGPYATALAAGRSAAGRGAPGGSGADGRALHRTVGPDYVALSDLRIEIQRFCKELLRTERRTVGRLDSRFTGMDDTGVDSEPEYDPSMAAIRPPFTAAFAAVRRDGAQLHRPTSRTTSSAAASATGRGTATTASSTPPRRCAGRLRITRTCGCSSPPATTISATPYFATAYTLSHLGLDPVAARSQ